MISVRSKRYSNNFNLSKKFLELLTKKIHSEVTQVIKFSQQSLFLSLLWPRCQQSLAHTEHSINIYWTNGINILWYLRSAKSCLQSAAMNKVIRQCRCSRTDLLGRDLSWDQKVTLLALVSYFILFCSSIAHKGRPERNHKRIWLQNDFVTRMHVPSLTRRSLYKG